MNWGEFELRRISDGELWLDGGAMFGVVPKPLWSKTTPCDDRNRIRLGTNCLLVRSRQRNLLIDTGCGVKYSPKEMSIYRIEREKGLLEGLSQCGLSPGDIDVVVNTHLHFDHAGGNTIPSPRGAEAAFPNATYVVQKQEYQEACNPHERNSASYRSDNWEALAGSGQLKLVEGEQEVIPGVRLIPTPGHTLGHQSVLIESQGRKLFYIADLCPTQAHGPLPWIMGYDLYPMTTLETRRRIYRQAIDEDWSLFFEHDPEKPLGTLKRENGRYSVMPLDWSDGG